MKRSALEEFPRFSTEGDKAQLDNPSKRWFQSSKGLHCSTILPCDVPRHRPERFITLYSDEQASALDATSWTDAHQSQESSN